LAVLLWMACPALPVHASDIHPLTIAIVEARGETYFEPAGRRLVIRSQPLHLFIRIRNTSEAAVLIRDHPGRAYSLELKDEAGVTTLVKRKVGKGGKTDDETQVNLSPGADRIIPMHVDRDTWEGFPDLATGKERTYTARIVYETSDRQIVYSESYTLVFSVLDSDIRFPKRPLPNGGDEPGTVVAGDVEPASRATGWFCQGGYIVTCYHAVKGHTSITVAAGNLPKRKASVVTTDETDDLAVLKLDDNSNIPSGIPISQQDPSLGEKVFTIGYPRIELLGQSPKFSDGVVSSTKGMHDDARILQMSVPVQAGNSGGPLLNKRGEVVGVVQSKLSAVTVFAGTGDLPQRVNYAVKSACLQPLIGKLPSDSAARLLPAQEAEMEAVAKRVQDSVVMILAE